MNIQSLSIVKTVYSRIFPGHLGIFKDIDTYSVTLTKRNKGEVSSTFSERQKKGSDCVPVWVNFSIQNVVLRVSRRKDSKIGSLRDLFFWCF